jgi:hypothetical protein
MGNKVYFYSYLYGKLLKKFAKYGRAANATRRPEAKIMPIKPPFIQLMALSISPASIYRDEIEKINSIIKPKTIDANLVIFSCSTDTIVESVRKINAPAIIEALI